MSFVGRKKRGKVGCSVEIGLRCPAMTHAKPYARLVTSGIWTLLCTLDPCTLFFFFFFFD